MKSEVRPYPKNEAMAPARKREGMGMRKAAMRWVSVYGRSVWNALVGTINGGSNDDDDDDDDDNDEDDEASSFPCFDSSSILPEVAFRPVGATLHIL